MLEEASLPFTPLHLVPGLMIYLLLFPRLDFPALMIATIFLDIEPFANLFLLRGQPIHGPLHSLMGASLVVAPILSAACRLLERRCEVLVEILNVLGWSPIVRAAPLRTTISSTYIGVASHLILDFWTHEHISPLYPFASGNPFQSNLLTFWTYVAIAAGLASTPLLYRIGTRLHRYKPFSHFP